jgi:hypothetical protein
VAVIWLTWQSELESLSVFAEEWTQDLAENFIRTVQGITARKRAQKEAIEKLAAEVRRLHETYQQLLAFFDLEQACLRWSVSNCPQEAAERVLAVLTDWRERLMGYRGKYPPPKEEMQSFIALQSFFREAQGDADLIRAGFGALDVYLAPQVEPVRAAEPSAAPPEQAPDGTDAELEPAAVSQTLAAGPDGSGTPTAAAESQPVPDAASPLAILVDA